MTHRGPFQPLLFCDSVILSEAPKASLASMDPAQIHLGSVCAEQANLSSRGKSQCPGLRGVEPPISKPLPEVDVLVPDHSPPWSRAALAGGRHSVWMEGSGVVTGWKISRKVS